MSSWRAFGLLVAMVVGGGCGGVDDRLVLDCPDGTSLTAGRHGAELERWCARPDGLRHGGFVRSRGERPTLTGQYRDGQKHGVWRQWNGAMLVGRYVMNRGTGVEPVWNGGARKITETSFQKGRRHGPYSEWHGNRQLKVIGFFENGKKSGRWVSFDDAGSVISETRFEVGKPIDTSQ